MNDFFAPIFSSIALTFLENPLGQFVGFIAMLVGITGFMIQDDRTTIKVFIVSCVFWILHFIFMANYGALAATCIGLLRLVLSLKYKKNMSVFSGIIAMSIAYGIYAFDGNILSVLPLLATAISSYGFFFLEKARLRILLAFVSLMWLIYHLATGSMSGILNEIIVQITIWYSVIMFLTGKERKQKILERFRQRIGKWQIRANYGRYVFLRDRNRFE